MIWMLIILLVLPPRTAGLFALALSAALLVHHHHLLSTAPVKVRVPGQSGANSNPSSVALAGPTISICLILGGLVAIGVSWQPGSTSVLEASKLAVAGLLLLVGSLQDVTQRRQWEIHVWISVLMMVAVSYHSVFRSFAESQTALFGFGLTPPLGNHASILVCVLAPVALGGLRRPYQILYLMLLVSFGLAIESRFVIGVAVILVAQGIARDRVVRLIAAAVAGLVVYGPRFRGLSFGSFSDRIRLQIWQVSVDRVVDNNMQILGDGESAFVDDLKSNPLFRSLEFEHAHNLLLHIWNSYGLVVAVVWVGALGWLVYALWNSSPHVNGQLLTFVAVAQIESVVSDFRVLGVILMMFGFRLRSASTVAGVGPSHRSGSQAKPLVRQREFFDGS